MVAKTINGSLLRGETLNLGRYPLANTGISADDVTAGAWAVIRVSLLSETVIERSSAASSEITISETDTEGEYEVAVEFASGTTSLLAVTGSSTRYSYQVLVFVPGGEMRLVGNGSMTVREPIEGAEVPTPDPDDALVAVVDVLRLNATDLDDRPNPTNAVLLGFHEGSLAVKHEDGTITGVGSGGGGGETAEEITCENPYQSGTETTVQVALNDGQNALTTGLSTTLSSANTYTDTSVSGLASQSYVNAAVSGLASETYVNTAVSGLASESYVDDAVDDVRRGTVLNDQTGASYTFLVSDAGKVIRGNRATAQAFLIPANTFAVGEIVYVRQVGLGQITVSGDVGVTIGSLGNKTRTQGSTVGFQMAAANSWEPFGDLE